MEVTFIEKEMGSNYFNKAILDKMSAATFCMGELTFASMATSGSTLPPTTSATSSASLLRAPGFVSLLELA